MAPAGCVLQNGKMGEAEVESEAFFRLETKMRKSSSRTWLKRATRPR